MSCRCGPGDGGPVRRGSVPGSEAGSGSVLMMGLMTVVCAMAFVAAVVGGYLIAGHRVRAAADLAAVSGAAAEAAGRDGCRAAGTNAVANRARLVRCDRVGDQVGFVLSVTVELRVGLAMPGLPTRLTATAHAGTIP